MLSRAALALLSALSAAAHTGCDGYQHGVDLYRRDPAMEPHIAELRARHPQVQARVLSQHEQRDLERRASPTTYAASLTRINSAGIVGLSSGTGTNEATQALPSQPTAGASSGIAGTPPLPAVAINPADWPALDRPPPTDTPQVQAWMNMIDFTHLPNFAPTQVGGCQNASNQQAISEAGSRCWWTCGGCTRATDVTFCPQTNTWGVSYDDGPSPWTPKLLNYLNAADLKTTIFAVGSRIISRPDMLQYEYLEGHQIAVHTWSHFPLTTLTNAQIVAELGWSKRAIQAVTGVTPKYMRPPYGDIDDRVRYISMMMGLTPIIWTAANGRTFDTQDWQIAGGVVNSTQVIANFDSVLNMASTLGHGFIVLQHDLYQQSVNLAVDYVLPKALSNPALSLQPIISCLGMNMAQAYVESSNNDAAAAVTTTLSGASGQGFVPSLISTPQALDGDATTRSGFAPTVNPSSIATHATVSSSSASVAQLSAALLGLTAFAVVLMA